MRDFYCESNKHSGQNVPATSRIQVYYGGKLRYKYLCNECYAEQHKSIWGVPETELDSQEESHHAERS